MHDNKSNLRFIQLHLYLLFTKNMINQKIPKAKKSAAKGLLELPIKKITSIADPNAATYLKYPKLPPIKLSKNPIFTKKGPNPKSNWGIMLDKKLENFITI